MTIAITLISCSTGYVAGGYKANKANYEDNIFAELEVAFIRENIAVDTLNHFKANNKEQAIKIQESAMCTLVQIIRSHPNLVQHDKFNSRVVNLVNTYAKQEHLDRCQFE